jgi:hypothetical protein
MLIWFVATYYIWFSLSWAIGYKILAEFLLVIIGPDVEGLFMSYRKYLNEQKPGGQDAPG